MKKNLPGKENEFEKLKCSETPSNRNVNKNYFGIRSRRDNTIKNLGLAGKGILKGSVAAGAALTLCIICSLPSTMAISFFPRPQYHKV